MGTAFLSSHGAYTTFSYGNKTLTFLTSKGLVKYLKIKEWDNGYLVVDASFKEREAEEEYIDLIPILKNLYMNEKTFLKPITEVLIKYD